MPHSLYPLLHPLIRRLAFALYWCFGGYRVEGVEHLPRRGPALVVCNHISVSDPVAMLGASPRRLWYMAARELHSSPVLGPLIRFLQAFPVTRGSYDAEALAFTRRLLRRGEAVVVFPEGGCSPDGTLQPLYPGVAALALRENCPLVPARMEGTDGFLPIGGRVLRFHPKRVAFGPPFRVGPLAPGVPVRRQVDRALERIRRALLDLGVPEGPRTYQGRGTEVQTRSRMSGPGPSPRASAGPPSGGTR